MFVTVYFLFFKYRPPQTFCHFIQFPAALFLPVSSPDGSLLAGSNFCAHVSSASLSRSTHGFPLFPCSGIPDLRWVWQLQSPETDTAEALPGCFHSIGSVLLHLQSQLHHSSCSDRFPDTGILDPRRSVAHLRFFDLPHPG